MPQCNQSASSQNADFSGQSASPREVITLNNYCAQGAFNKSALLLLIIETEFSVNSSYSKRRYSRNFVHL